MAFSVEQIKGVIGSEGGLARPNLFAVQLPQLPGSSYSGQVLNLLTKSVQLPPRQQNMLERNINGYRSKVVNGSLTDDIQMTFHVTNSMVVKEYFESWMELQWNKTTRRVGYFRDYAKQVSIKVLNLPENDFTIKLPNLPFAANIPDIGFGPINASFASGMLSLDFGQNTVQEITLENAYPMTMNPIEMSDGAEGFMEISVSFTYSEWYSKAGLGNKLAGVFNF